MKIIVSILKTLYELLWISLIPALFFSIVTLYVKGIQLKQPGWKSLFNLLKAQFKLPHFRRSFYLYIYSAMILYQTLFGRKVWVHPLQAVFRGWKMITYYGALDMQVVENALIFTPFIILLFRAYGEKIIKGNTVWSYLFSALKITALFSFSIEVLQAVLHLGTLQISDFCYNVVGGVIGGFIYRCGCSLKSRVRRQNIKQWKMKKTSRNL